MTSIPGPSCRRPSRASPDVYGTIGRTTADINPQIALDVPNRKINITLEVNEGPEVFIERINISGNTRSQEKILRRELPMAEGDLFTTEKLARAKQKLINLNYFEKVETKTTPGSSKDKIIVNIDVTEKPTGLFSIGGGYSSQDGALGTLDLSQNNFLGKGYQLFLKLRGGTETQQGTIGFTDPWFLDRPLAAGFDIFNNRRVYQDYTQSTRSAATCASALRSATTAAGTPCTGSARRMSPASMPNASRSCWTRKAPRSRPWSEARSAGTRGTA